MNENVVLNEQDILALPFVPLRGIVVYPKLVSHIDIGRDKSLAAVDYAMEHDRQLLVATQSMKTKTIQVSTMSIPSAAWSR